MVSLDLGHPARAASQRSMNAVQARDRDAWLAIFTEDAVIQDPVGVSPLDPAGEGHRGPEARATFWDTFIAPTESIGFDLHGSYAGGNEVANVATLTMRFPDGASAVCEAVLLYRVDEAGQVESLKAFWEYDAMMATFTPGGGAEG